MSTLVKAQPIRVLAENVVNQIAAGEVVECPAHLAKELLENSLDSGATHIELSFAQGGRELKVRDNGCGIAPQDIPLALKPHATSKLRDFEDIWSCGSFGFRGEALASIASVSCLSVRSKASGATGTMQKSHFGALSEPQKIEHPQGTSVSVERLFESTPARLKFLKSSRYEEAQIKQVFKTLALAHPDKSFKLTKGESLVYFLEKSSPLERARQMLGVPELFQAQGEHKGVAVTAYIAPPHITAKTRKNMWCFVGKRWVEDSSLRAGFLEAYRSLLMHREFPIGALFVSLPAGEVDVNVHPTKTKVKFLNASRVFSAARSILRAALERSPWLETLSPCKVADSASMVTHQEPLKTPIAPASGTQAATKTPARPAKNLSTSANAQAKLEHRLNPKPIDRLATPSLQKDFFKLPPPATSIKAKPSLQQSPLEQPPAHWQPSQNFAWSNLPVLGFARRTYIITETTDGVLFIDQHAAHERVLYERFMQQFKSHAMHSQRLLLPLEVELEPDKQETLKQWLVHGGQDQVRALGIELELSAKGLRALGLPLGLKERALGPAMEQLAEEVQLCGNGFALQGALEAVVATMACHSAIRAGYRLKMEEAQKLLSDMDAFSFSSFCPHGRPVFVKYPFNRLEKDFGRA